jgi:hypothetical protein
MNLLKSLLFLHGHIADPPLARSLAGSDTDTNAHSDATDAGSGREAGARGRVPSPRLSKPAFPLFSSLWYLGGLDDIDPRIGEHEQAFGPTYGHRAASARRFGHRRDDAASLAGCAGCA